MLSPTTKTWNIFVLHGFCPGDKLGGLLFCLDLIWLLDSVPVASEQNPTHLLVGLTSTQKGREGLMVQSVNPQNCRPVFSSTQLSASLQATAMLLVALRGIITMDIEELQKDILSAYDTDPAVQSFHTDSNNSKYSRWSVDDVGFVRIDQRILVPEFGDLQLHVLQSFHDHPVSGHYGVNKTFLVIRWEYTWPNIWEFVADYVKSCTTCARSKAK
jgi:Integrase zinc binding domain